MARYPVLFSPASAVLAAAAAAFGLYAGAAERDWSDPSGPADLVALSTVPEGLASVSCDGASDPASAVEFDGGCWYWVG
jgi:hypothetical protein